LGSQTTINATSSQYGYATLLDTNKVLFLYNATGGGTGPSYFRTATISGTTLTLSSEVANNTFPITQNFILFGTRTNEAYAFNAAMQQGYLVSAPSTAPSATEFAIRGPQPSGIATNFSGVPGNFGVLSTGKVLFLTGGSSLTQGIGVWNDNGGVIVSGVNFALTPTSFAPNNVIALSATTGVATFVIGGFASFSYLEIA
jgi:hypothetical protein